MLQQFLYFEKEHFRYRNDQTTILLRQLERLIR